MDSVTPLTNTGTTRATLLHTRDTNLRVEIDLDVFKCESDELAIEYGTQEEPVIISLDMDHLYVEFTDINGIEHKVELL